MWDDDPVSLNCPSYYYNITSNNCGTCPNSTNSPTATCFNFTATTSGVLCMFGVQVVVCGGTNFAVGGTTNITMVNLTGITITSHS